MAELEQQIAVETPEQVVVSYTIAGLGSRAAAALIDYFICLVIAFGLVLAMWSLVRGLSWSTSWLIAAVVLLLFAVFWGYYVVFEGLWDGQTPGKRRLGLRVVRDGGFSVSFGESGVRNVLRVIDMQPLPTYGVGVASVILSPTGKRLGDYAAGTIVVREQPVTMGVPAAIPAVPGEPGLAPVLTTALTDDEYTLLERFMARRQMLDPDRRSTLTAQLATRFRQRAPDLTGADAALLVQLFARERDARARGAAGRSGTGAAREQHAIVARGTPRWQEFASILGVAQRGGLAALSESEVADFVARYRELSGDLARLQTAVGARDASSLFYLNRLVAAGHNLLYRQRRLAWQGAWEYVTITVPREIRRSALPIGLAALLMFGPATIAYVAIVRHPSLVTELVPPGMIDRAERGVEWAKRGEGYIPDPREMRPLMASMIMSNNIWVAFVAFGGGLSAGLLTIYALVQNGIMFGSILGLYQTKGILSLIVAFVAPHGVLELTAITLAGAAGLLVASAFILPGPLTRREALVVRGRRAIALIAGATLMLIVAGSLEGLVSPIPWWTLKQKLTVSGLTAILLLLYVNMDRGRELTVD